MILKELPWTGERLVTSIFNFGAIDHLHRYALTFDLVKNKDVLDIASGEGYGTHLISMYSKSVIGVDISAEAVAHAQEKYKKDNLEFRVGSTDLIPVKDNSIDVVVSFETIEHHDRHEEMIIEIKRVLKIGGLLIISSPDKLNYSEKPKVNNPFHIKELYHEEFKTLLNKHFSNIIFLNQKNVYGSLIIPEEKLECFSEFSGDYDCISTFSGIHDQVYNLALASSEPIKYEIVSFFDGKLSTDNSNNSQQFDQKNKSIVYKLKQIVKLLTPPLFIKIFSKFKN